MGSWKHFKGERECQGAAVPQCSIYAPCVLAAAIVAASRILRRPGATPQGSQFSRAMLFTPHGSHARWADCRGELDLCRLALIAAALLVVSHYPTVGAGRGPSGRFLRHRGHRVHSFGDGEEEHQQDYQDSDGHGCIIGGGGAWIYRVNTLICFWCVFVLLAIEYTLSEAERPKHGDGDKSSDISTLARIVLS
jgi:hypothetical protein